MDFKGVVIRIVLFSNQTTKVSGCFSKTQCLLEVHPLQINLPLQYISGSTQRSRNNDVEDELLEDNFIIALGLAATKNCFPRA